MTDPALLESLRGQQYLVLRPVQQVASFYEDEQRALRRRLPAALPGPRSGHVTLRGFFEPRRVSALLDLLAEWATEQIPIQVRVAAIDGFPAPFQVFIARIERSPALVEAYSSLTSLLDSTDFQRIGELPLEDWTFHLSLLYGNSLSESDWDRHLAAARRHVSVAPVETLTSVDYVWYDDEGEHIQVLPLGRPQQA